MISILRDWITLTKLLLELNGINAKKCAVKSAFAKLLGSKEFASLGSCGQINV
jgi:hypothetical protein